MVNQNRKACAYCGRQTNMATDECENCGSTTFESLEQAELHQEQHRQFNQTHQQQAAVQKKSAPAQKKKFNIMAIGVVAMIILVVFSVIMSQCDNNPSNPFDPSDSDPKTTTHNLNSSITTDWFKMTVYEGKIIRTKNNYCGLDAPSSGNERVLVDINLDNYLREENLDINIDDDFYLESGTTRYRSLNTGGGYTMFDKLTVDGMFFGKFMVSPKTQLHGYIAFDIPASVYDLKFVYEEYEYEGDERTEVKHFYKVDLEYDTPNIPLGPAKTFYDKAYDAGYVLEIINDYDGYETFWIGAHKYIDESSKGITKKPEPVYWVDFTKDLSEHNAGVEYTKFVDKVKRIGGAESSSSGTSSGKTYRYQSNTSSTKYGVAYQIDVYNYLVETAPVSYKQEILDFFDMLSFKIA